MRTVYGSVFENWKARPGLLVVVIENYCCNLRIICNMRVVVESQISK